MFAICLNNSLIHIGNIKLGPVNEYHNTADISYFLGDKNYGVINIGSSIETSINYLAKSIVSETNSSSKIEHVSESPDDPKRRQADTSKAKKCINWEPKVTLESGLAKTIDWIKSINL